MWIRWRAPSKPSHARGREYGQRRGFLRRWPKHPEGTEPELTSGSSGVSSRSANTLSIVWRKSKRSCSGTSRRSRNCPATSHDRLANCRFRALRFWSREDCATIKKVVARLSSCRRNSSPASSICSRSLLASSRFSMMLRISANDSVARRIMHGIGPVLAVDYIFPTLTWFVIVPAVRLGSRFLQPL